MTSEELEIQQQQRERDTQLIEAYSQRTREKDEFERGAVSLKADWMKAFRAGQQPDPKGLAEALAVGLAAELAGHVVTSMLADVHQANARLAQHPSSRAVRVNSGNGTRGPVMGQPYAGMPHFSYEVPVGHPPIPDGQVPSSRQNRPAVITRQTREEGGLRTVTHKVS